MTAPTVGQDNRDFFVEAFTHRICRVFLDSKMGSALTCRSPSGSTRSLPSQHARSSFSHYIAHAQAGESSNLSTSRFWPLC
jgi:hypothetical protein